MGQKINPGMLVSVANQKGGVGKSTITLLLADYLHRNREKLGLKVGVVDCDDMQNSLTRKREREIKEMSEEERKNLYKVMNIPSQDFSDQVETLQQMYDIIFVDLPGNMKQEGVMPIYYLIDVAFVPTESSEFDIDSTNLFFNQYNNVIAKRTELGFKTSIFGMFNKINPKLKEFIELYENKDSLAVPFLDNFIKDSKVKYQRNTSTIISKKSLAIENLNLCKEMLEKIIEHKTNNHGKI